MKKHPIDKLPTYEQLAHLYAYTEAIVSRAVEAYETLNQLSELNGHLAYHLYQQLGAEQMDDEARALIHNIVQREKEVEDGEKAFIQAINTLSEYKDYLNEVHGLKKEE